MPRTRYAHLLEDPDLKRWYDNNSRGSRVTADVYLRRLGAFCANRGLGPGELVSLGDEDLHNLLLDYVTWAEAEGHAGSYIHSSLKAVKSWLSHNRVDTRFRIKINGLGDTPSLRKERVPTPGELKKILLSGDKKARAACVLVAHSGLRIGVLGDYRGRDGLCLGDIPEISINEDGVGFEKTPAQIVVRRELSKAGHQYFSFLGDEGCSCLSSYLEERIRGGEELGEDSAVIVPKSSPKDFVTSTNIGDTIRAAIRGAGYSWRPYVLRSYFDTRLMLAESKGLILRDYRQFWMGHTGDIENRYTTNKGVLPPSVIEDMRQSYQKAEELLQTEKLLTSKEDIRIQFRAQLLLVAGFKEEEIDEEKIGEMEDEEFQGMVRKRLLGEMINNGATQKVVPAADVESHLSKGWEFVASLPDGKAILKLPK